MNDEWPTTKGKRRVHHSSLIIHHSSFVVSARGRRMGIFSGKIGLVMGVANDRSIAWAMSEALYAEGAELAWDLGRKNIRVNALSAGPVRTLSSAGIADFDQMQEHAARKSCLGRNVSLEELGATGVYLLSPLSGGVTGETIHVDCGYSIIGL
jgi:enoyl-[acyl-carrier-protein] reductase (NADH)